MSWRWRIAVAVVVVLLCMGGVPKPAGATVEAKPIQVPYKLTATKHILVRAKINDRGPFNLVIDTGAPAIVLSKKVSDLAGVDNAVNGWSTLDRFEIEGGVTLNKATARFDDLYQLEGMNGLGLAGAEIHGLVGYPVLARFRITYDFTKSKMEWTLLQEVPEELPRRAARGMAPGGLDALGSIMKGVGKLLGANQMPDPKPRGFLGFTPTMEGELLKVAGVLRQSPADRAGIRAGDQITAANGKNINSVDALAKAQGSLTSGETLRLTITRDGATSEIAVELGGGF